MNVAKRGGWAGASGVSSGVEQSPSPAGKEGRRERERGTEKRGVEKMGESTLFFLPSSERVAIDTAHLIKNVCPPSFFSVCNTEPQSVQLLPFRLKCSPLQDTGRRTDRHRERASELGGCGPRV